MAEVAPDAEDLDLIRDLPEEDFLSWATVASQWGEAHAFAQLMGDAVIEGFPPAFTPLEFSERPAPPWLVPLHIPSGLTCIFGQTNAGKTFVSLDAALNIATGGHWLGQPVNQRNVMYFLAEGQGLACQRIDAWCQAHGMTMADLEGRFWVVPQRLPLRGVVPDGINMAVVATKLDLGLIVLDTWARTLERDENDNTEVSSAVNLLTDIRTNSPGSDLSVWVIHHTGLTETHRMRGASSLAAAVDCEVMVEGHLNEAVSHVQISCAKQRDAAFFPTVLLDAMPVGESIAFNPQPRAPMNLEEPQVSGNKKRGDGVREQLMQLLGLGPRTAKELAEMLPVSTSTVNRMVADLMQEGAIQVDALMKPPTYRKVQS